MLEHRLIIVLTNPQTVCVFIGFPFIFFQMYGMLKQCSAKNCLTVFLKERIKWESAVPR